MTNNYIFELDMKVRDYECDLQGIVKNANYQHYMEHTRHEFLTSKGASFAQLHEQIVPDYLGSLQRGHYIEMCSAMLQS